MYDTKRGNTSLSLEEWECNCLALKVHVQLFSRMTFLDVYCVSVYVADNHQKTVIILLEL